MVGSLVILAVSPLFNLIFMGAGAAGIPGFIAVFEVLPRWNGVSSLSPRQEKSESQNNTYLITTKAKLMTITTTKIIETPTTAKL
jgi:hypothetical protein